MMHAIIMTDASIILYDDQLHVNDITRYDKLMILFLLLLLYFNNYFIMITNNNITNITYSSVGQLYFSLFRTIMKKLLNIK